VQVDGACEGGHLALREVSCERGRRLLRAAVIHAEVCATEVQLAEGRDRALADGYRIHRVEHAVVVRRVTEQRAGVEEVAGVVDADPGAAIGRPGDPRHRSPAQLADEEPTVPGARI